VAAMAMAMAAATTMTMEEGVLLVVVGRRP
jgi:hypothetical protein